MRIVLDASIVAKWFITEEYSDLALTIRAKFVEGEIDLITPDLLNYEVLNALKYSKLFPIADLKDAATALDEYAITQLPLNGEYAQKTVQIAEKYNLTIYDAAYAALADFLDIHFYSADKKLIEKLDRDYKGKMLFIKDIRR